MNEHNQHSYENGSTRPPESHGGLIAVVLCICIVLLGVASVMGVLNQLTRNLYAEPGTVICFEPGTGTSPSQVYVSGQPTLALEGQWVSSFYQQFRGLPAGLYITGAPADSGIRTKDILLSINGKRVTSQEELDGVLYAHRVGDRVNLTLYRDGRQYSVELTLQETGK